MSEHDELCPVCGSPMDYVCKPDGTDGGMHCWACWAAPVSAQENTNHE